MCNLSDQAIENRVKEYQDGRAEPSERCLRDYLMAIRREKASRAAHAKAKKHPKWSQKRRRAFLEKKYRADT